MPRLKPALLLTLTLCSAALGAQASPASELFERVSSLFVTEYYGWSAADRPALVAKYAAELQKRCRAAGEACSFEAGREVLAEMFDELHDDHTSVRDAETAQRLLEVQNDLSVPRTGARVIKQPGGLLVVGIQAGSPAESAGLKLYDLIKTVNGQPAGKDQAVDSLIFVRLERTAAPMTLTVQRPGVSLRSASTLPRSCSRPATSRPSATRSRARR